ncbi:hypothetical protein FYJ85_13840 [Victivallaceae bacterium BBE-744-WT-12]|uniref:Uncharacterized protein n=1 Tax=Victivallis lenta TaxID=2606640 RepID=A0A844G6B9_9BACT|nr:hypothetical protein [Victivallis lenta]MST98121.1 hypothetical protein [Victivallis lenta]
MKTKNRRDGFAIVGSCLVCALCGAELGGAEPASGDAAGQKAAERLAALLGEGAAPEAGADLTPDADYGRFCRNCIHFIEHPFRTLCGRDGRTADPMGECGHFKRKEYLC